MSKLIKEVNIILISETVIVTWNSKIKKHYVETGTPRYLPRETCAEFQSVHAEIN